jgi:hypothetical protein
MSIAKRIVILSESLRARTKSKDLRLSLSAKKYISFAAIQEPMPEPRPSCYGDLREISQC